MLPSLALLILLLWWSLGFRVWLRFVSLLLLWLADCLRLWSAMSFQLIKLLLLSFVFFKSLLLFPFHFLIILLKPLLSKLLDLFLLPLLLFLALLFFLFLLFFRIEWVTPAMLSCLFRILVVRWRRRLALGHH